MKKYRPWAPLQSFLLPPSPLEWLPEGHLAYWMLDLVQNALDLEAITGPMQEKDARGTQPYHPKMLTALLLYAYCVGIPSSRKIEALTYTDLAFRVIAGGTHPDHCVISEFRRTNLPALAALFLQVLKLCQKAGLVKLGHVALDGTKVKANASKHKAMSYERMLKSEKELKEEIAKLLERAEQTDEKEERDGDEDLPGELKRRETRLKAIQRAKAALEAEAAAARALEKAEQARRAEEKAAEAAEEDKRQAETLAKKRRAEADVAAEQARQQAEQRVQFEKQAAAKSAEAATTSKDKRAAGADAQAVEAANQDQARLEDRLNGIAATVPEHQVPASVEGTPKPEAQRNFTDPDSRIMKSGGSYEQGYNSQIVVSEGAQIIVGQVVGNQAPDAEYLRPLLDEVERNCGATPKKLTADTGYWSDANGKACDDKNIDPHIAIGRDKHEKPSSESDGGPPPTDVSDNCRKERMRQKLRTEEGRAIYARRKATVEPVFGQIKEARGFRRFLLRGLEKVRGEWSLICTGHNLLKLFRSGQLVAAAN